MTLTNTEGFQIVEDMTKILNQIDAQLSDVQDKDREETEEILDRVDEWEVRVNEAEELRWIMDNHRQTGTTENHYYHDEVSGEMGTMENHDYNDEVNRKTATKESHEHIDKGAAEVTKYIVQAILKLQKKLIGLIYRNRQDVTAPLRLEEDDYLKGIGTWKAWAQKNGINENEFVEMVQEAIRKMGGELPYPDSRRTPRATE
ncbi:hypothetical protein PtA15_3A626 [Puccinia triticina]|nr:uncharacterized protein PtA15_3A626 [Puccinia triticina]WAQ83257.1 hypothetical protein PtA15_3A626 [Puccinia triticina]